MNIELRNIKINLAFSEETTQFKADIYVDGVKVGYASNDGCGGPTFYNPISASAVAVMTKAENYCKTLPPYTWTYREKVSSMPMTLEILIDDIIEKHVTKKETAAFEKKLQRNMLKGLVCGTPASYTVITWTGHTIASMLLSVQGRATLANKVRVLTAEGKTILNTNLPTTL